MVVVGEVVQMYGATAPYCHSMTDIEERIDTQTAEEAKAARDAALKQAQASWNV